MWLEQYLWGWCLYEAAVSGSWFICLSGVRVWRHIPSSMIGNLFLKSLNMEVNKWKEMADLVRDSSAQMGRLNNGIRKISKVKSRDLRSVAALQDTSVEWLGLLTLTVVSTCMGDCHPRVSACQETSYPATSIHMWHSLIIELVGETRHWRTDSTPRGLQVLGIKAPTRAIIKSRSADRKWRT